MKKTSVAKTPPMGWNSWDCYGAAVTEEEVLGNARYLSEHLKKYGWEYVVVDIQWYEPQAVSSIYNAFYPLEMDEYSRLMPAANRFPSAAGGKGFKPLGDKIHDMGLKFGIHMMRGIPRQAVHQNTKILGSDQRARDIAHTNSICPWNTDMYGVDPAKEGAQAYYDSLFELYASWGVDYIKVDDIAASRLYGTHGQEICMIKKAIDNCGREMVLSLSPGPAPLSEAPLLKEHANMWRMTDDFWDKWKDLYPMFERCRQWAPHVGPGSWPDCDMLPIGHIGIRSVDGFWDEENVDITRMKDRQTRFTKTEQKTMLSLWCMFRSPLMVGCELRDLDPWTLSLLTNEALLGMLQNIERSRQFSREGDKIIWIGEAGREFYIALFNAGEETEAMSACFKTLGLKTPDYVLDVWSGKTPDELTFSVPRHGTILLKGGFNDES